MAIIQDLVVSEYGTFVSQRGRRLRLETPEQAAIDAPLMHLLSVRVLTRAASLSSSAIAACCEQGIPIHFIDPVEGCYASLLSPTLTTVATSRRCQILAAQTPLGLKIAKQIVRGKLQSQISHLRYLCRRAEAEQQHMVELTILDLQDCIAQIDTLQGEHVGDVRAELMGIEGYGSKCYWEVYGLWLPNDYGWSGRTGRHATDSINSLLNYGYGILYSEIQNALVIAGLEPYVGLLHTDRPGKPSLVLDLIEEFRAPIVDRTVMGLARRGFKVESDANGRMSRDTRKAFAEHILKRLNAQGKYQRKRWQLRSIIQMQARLLAAAFREEATYTAYIGG